MSKFLPGDWVRVMSSHSAFVGDEVAQVEGVRGTYVSLVGVRHPLQSEHNRYPWHEARFTRLEENPMTDRTIFKPGDRVKRIDRDYNSVKKGETYTVERQESRNLYLKEVSGSYSFDSFELAQWEPQGEGWVRDDSRATGAVNEESVAHWDPQSKRWHRWHKPSPLPTEAGWYMDASGEIWQLDSRGSWESWSHHGINDGWDRRPEAQGLLKMKAEAF